MVSRPRGVVSTGGEIDGVLGCHRFTCSLIYQFVCFLPLIPLRSPGTLVLLYPCREVGIFRVQPSRFSRLLVRLLADLLRLPLGGADRIADWMGRCHTVPCFSLIGVGSEHCEYYGGNNTFRRMRSGIGASPGTQNTPGVAQTGLSRYFLQYKLSMTRENFMCDTSRQHALAIPWG